MTTRPNFSGSVRLGLGSDRFGFERLGARWRHFDFPNGVPKTHEHDGKPPQGFGLFSNGRLSVERFGLGYYRVWVKPWTSWHRVELVLSTSHGVRVVIDGPAGR